MESFSETTGVYDLPKFIDGISFNKNKQLALISSNLTGKFWHGAIGVFNDAKMAPHLPHLDYAAKVEAGCIDLAWIDPETIAVATDAGTVDIWKLKESPVMENIIMLAEHDDICSSIDVSPHSGQLLSGSYDNTLKLWDLEVDLSINTITLHVDKILDVAWCTKSAGVFVSASEDGTVKVYDTRESEKPGSLLYYSTDDNPQCLTWLDENRLCVGFNNGNVGTLDLRNPWEIVNMLEVHKKPVNTVLYLENNLIASCSDDMSVKVHHIEEGTMCYTDSNHSDYVQDLAFDASESVLFSCAYDGKVVNHNIDFIRKET